MLNVRRGVFRKVFIEVAVSGTGLDKTLTRRIFGRPDYLYDFRVDLLTFHLRILDKLLLIATRLSRSLDLCRHGTRKA